ncbi:Fungalysin metallopeptidase-domain-containing protein [Lactarius deliciosus]|nr:Fungalysin metallopeptidase-domain-containing protein [Lactarius deliciosus]
MVAFAPILPTVLFSLLFVSTTSATPQSWAHRTHYVGADRNLKLEAYHPESTFQASSHHFRFGVDGVDPFPTYRRYPRDTPDISAAAVTFLASNLGVPEESIHPRASAQGQAAHHVFLVQKITIIRSPRQNGVPVANAVANVAFNNHRKVSSFSSSFVEHCQFYQAGAADTDPSVSLADAITTAEKMLSGTYNGYPTTLEFVVQPNGFAALTHVIQIQNEPTGTWYEAFVDAHNNTLLSLTDFVAKASYRVLPIHEQDPTQGFQTITDPQDKSASPNGWHQEFSTATNLTAGNNAIAYKGSQLIDVTVQSSADLNFIYDVDLTKDPSSGTNVQAATTNAFYVVNTFHDFTYEYGFTETTFNFQTNNLNKGGEGFDRILVSVQDDYGINDAVFFTPPEGLTSTQPRLDSALQNDLVIHECQHGASNRMTGGGTARCFQTSESAGVAEGYADAMADEFTQHMIAGTDRLTYEYPKSVTNPLRYSSLKGMTDAHDMGEVWANALHNVYAALVISNGWSKNALTDPTTNEGNVVWLHLFIDALLLQPCNPTCENFSFGPYSVALSRMDTDTEWSVLNARDAWIQADANRYKGAHTCLLWATFASRGFGVNATNFVDDVSYPLDCDC